MPLGTKGGSIIVKDGKVAENCRCCKPDCNSIGASVTLTLSGLPRGCTNQFSTYAVGDLSNWNDCSFTLRRASPCVYTASLPGFTTDYFRGCSDTWIVTLNVDTNTLSIGDFIAVKPDDDTFFGNLPYSGNVVAAWPSQYTLCDFSNLHVTLDKSEPLYVPPTCTPSGVPNTSPELTYGLTCEPCEASAFGCSDRTMTWPYFIDGAYPELTAQLSFSELSIDSFTGSPNPYQPDYLPDNPGTIPGLRSMSGSYALKWTDVTRYNAKIGVTFNSDWSIAGTPSGYTYQPPGGFDVAYSGCGWYGLFYSTPYGEPDTGKGYERVFSDGNPLRELAAIEIAVVPMGWHLPYDASTKQLSRIRCENGDVAFQVRIKCYSILGGFADSGYGYYVALGYWSQPLSVFTSAPCKSLSCRGKPSFSISQKAYTIAQSVYLANTYYYYAQVGARMSCDVSVNVS